MPSGRKVGGLVRRGVWLALMPLSLAALLLLVFFLGGAQRHLDYFQLRADQQRLQLLADELQRQLDEREQQYTNLSVAAEVDRLAVEEVRQTVKRQQQTIAELSEENTFYKGLMAPSELERGLSLRSWELLSSSNPRRFYFKLVVQQLAVKHRLLTGDVVVTVLGSRNGEPVRLPLQQLSAQVAKARIKLRFKYFQPIEGELLLPDGFVPEGVEVKARASKPRKAEVERYYPWRLQG